MNFQERIMNSKFTKIIWLSSALIILLGSLSTLQAQQPVAPQAVQTQPAVNPAQAETASGVTRVVDQYRIGAGDLLTIRVTAGRLVPELSIDGVEVDECGRIPVASVEQEVENEIQAAGKTRAQLAEELRLFYKKYKRNPQVMVIVKEYKSQPVAINGAILKPGQFQMRRPVRLLELVQFYAGGPTERSGGIIQLARASSFNPCTSPAADSSASIDFAVFELKDTLAGEEKSNPYLQPGDVVTLPEAKEAYVVGNVLRPGPVLLKNSNVTVSQAIAMAGGTMQDTKKDKIRLLRREPSGQIKQEIPVDLVAIERRQKDDITLLPNDIVIVEVAGGKRLFRSLVGAIVPSVGQLPVRVIP
jgi:polysaccharide export outer membrane protein